MTLDIKKKSNLNNRQIISAFNTTVTTIITTAKYDAKKGLEYAVPHHYDLALVRPRKINGELEAHVIQLAYSNDPKGCAGWSLESLRKEVNKKGVA